MSHRRPAMTDERHTVPGEDTYETERTVDAPEERDTASDPPEEPNPWLREGADAPDAADIEDPAEQR
jgi:hypothetical protein